MPSISVKLPLMRSERFGFMGNNTAESMAKQNLKMLLLTNPGERIMIPNFGVGLKRYLFEPLTEETFGSIMSRINIQTKKFIPYIKVINIDFKSGASPTEIALNHQFDNNSVSIELTYRIQGDSGLYGLQLYV
tara:strand:+ start:383 stop:781 length:399 start_codon:yes stop_codon:yes gene_type:complete